MASLGRFSVSPKIKCGKEGVGLIWRGRTVELVVGLVRAEELDAHRALKLVAGLRGTGHALKHPVVALSQGVEHAEPALHALRGELAHGFPPLADLAFHAATKTEKPRVRRKGDSGDSPAVGGEGPGRRSEEMGETSGAPAGGSCVLESIQVVVDLGLQLGGDPVGHGGLVGHVHRVVRGGGGKIRQVLKQMENCEN